MNSARNRSVSTPHNAGESLSSSRIRGRRLILLAPSGARSLRPDATTEPLARFRPSRKVSALFRVGADFYPEWSRRISPPISSPLQFLLSNFLFLTPAFLPCAAAARGASPPTEFARSSASLQTK